jgi:hypothetical protein
MLGDSGIGKLAAWVLGVALAWSQGCSESPPAKPDAGASEAYHLSYLPGQIQTALDSIDGAFQSQRTRFTAAQLAVAKQVLEEQLIPEKLEKRTLERLAESAAPGFLDATLEWLRTPHVQRIVQARIAAESPTGVAEMKGFFDQKQANPPSEKRLELIERYNRATRLSRLAEETVLLSGYGVAVMADAVAPAAERLGPEAVRESMDNRRTLLSSLRFPPSPRSSPSEIFPTTRSKRS